MGQVRPMQRERQTWMQGPSHGTHTHRQRRHQKDLGLAQGDDECAGGWVPEAPNELREHAGDALRGAAGSPDAAEPVPFSSSSPFFSCLRLSSHHSLFSAAGFLIKQCFDSIITNSRFDDWALVAWRFFYTYFLLSKVLFSLLA